MTAKNSIEEVVEWNKTLDEPHEITDTLKDKIDNIDIECAEVA